MHWAGNRWTAAVVNLFAVRPAKLSMPAELDSQKLVLNSYNIRLSYIFANIFSCDCSILFL